VEVARPGESEVLGAEVAYDAIAPVYDDFTAHHNYDAWLQELLSYLERQGLSGKRLLDVACGTGKSFIPMLGWGWQVTASDISASMVELARQKVGDRAELSVADMRQLPHFGEFDLVWCLDDAVNYLLSGEELEQALRAIRPNLEPETGLLLFDTNELDTYRTFFAEEVEVEMNGRRLIWHGHSTPEAAPGSIAEAVFEVEPLADTEAAPIPPETHRQRHFPEAEILAALERCGYEPLEVYGMSTDGILRQPLETERHSKAVYISRLARG
jgi:SAM-dependent methyltransferase